MLCEAVPLLPGLAQEAVGGRGRGEEERERGGERGGEKKNKREGEDRRGEGGKGVVR